LDRPLNLYFLHPIHHSFTENRFHTGRGRAGNLLLMKLIKAAWLLLGAIGQNNIVNADKLPTNLRGNSVAVTGEDREDHYKDAQERKLQHSNHFKESACNANIATVACTPIQTFLNTNTTTTTSPADAEVKIPCGSCVTMDVTDNSVFHFPHGLNVVGKLHIPEDSSFELRTKYVLVQGYMTMDRPSVGQTTIPRADGAKINVVLEGSEHVVFTPDADGDNSMTGQQNIGSKPFAVAGGKLDINAIDDACPSWTTLNSLSADKTEITLRDPLAAACWAAGAELLFTPDEVGTPRNTQVATIASSDPTAGIITLTAPLPTRSTSIQDNFGEHFAVEVALLTRRITFKPDDNANLIGGHTIIHHTQGVEQNIKGIEFLRFGQQGELGKYPLHFHMSEGVYGSTVSKNLVRQSNQRCYVIHGTHGVTLSDNVAYDTFGHCFMIEDGGEHHNKFLRNLGSMTKIPAKIIRAGETDGQPTTFWMPNPVNDWEGNVAAGSDSFGFWLEPMLRGPSQHLAINTGFHPAGAPMGVFDDNKAHSCVANGIAFYPHGYMPWNQGPQIMNGLVAIKNAAPGIRVGSSNQLHFHGAFISDNGGGIENSGGANNVVRDSVIERISQHQRSLLSKGRGGQNPCGIGITFPNDKDHKGQGSEFYNVTFRNFDPWITGNPNPTGPCPAAAISSTMVSPRHLLYAMKIKFHTLKFEGEGSSYPNHRLDVCGASSQGTTGFAFDDLDGSISPDGVPGTFLQQGDPALMALKPNNCKGVGGCLIFCPASCYRHIKLDVPGTDVGKTAVVTRSDGVSATLPRKQFLNWNAHYGTALQGGYSYQITFIDGTGKETWPISVTTSWYPAPGCTPNLSTVDVELIPPLPSSKPSSSPTISSEPTLSPKPTISPDPTGYPTVSQAPTHAIEACYLQTGTCPEGFTDKGIAGIIAQNDSIGFSRGGSFNSDWTWYHPRLCCGKGVPDNTNSKAMCPQHGKNNEYLMGHWMTAGSPNPYGGGGGNDGAWDWRHPLTCAADSSSACVFSEDEKCRPGYHNWGKARIIMRSDSNFQFNVGAYNSDWNYHTPWLCCTEGVEQTYSPTLLPTMEPTVSFNPTPTPSKRPTYSPVIPAPIPLVDACYLSAGSCPNGYVSEGWSGVLGKETTPFNRGGIHGHGWYWHHPLICCGPPGPPPEATDMYAMCPSGVGTMIGHNHAAAYDDPYGNGGGVDGAGWYWRHPYPCSPSNANACVFTRTSEGPAGYTYKGQSRIIMNSSGTLTATYGQKYNGWWYHQPHLFCKDG